MGKIKKQGLRELVYKELKDMIINYRFTPGVKLNVEQLAKELGVSRTPVWQAVGLLESEGLITRVPNRGLFMSVLTPGEALDLYAVRQVLECMAAGLAAERITDSTLKFMKENLQKQKKIITEQDVIEYSRLDFEYHAAVYETTGNNVLREFLENLKNKMCPLDVHLKSILINLYEDHIKIYEALKDRKAKEAQAAFKIHNERVISHIKKEFATNYNKGLNH